MMEYKGYHATIKYDADDEVFHGKVVGIRDYILFQSESADDMEKEFRISIDDYLEWCAEDERPPDKPFSGVFMAHIAPEVHRAAVFAAYDSGKNLDDWLERAVKVAIADTKATNKKLPTSVNLKARNGAGDEYADNRRNTLPSESGTGQEPLLREGGDG